MLAEGKKKLIEIRKSGLTDITLLKPSLVKDGGGSIVLWGCFFFCHKNWVTSQYKEKHGCRKIILSKNLFFKVQKFIIITQIKGWIKYYINEKERFNWDKSVYRKMCLVT